MLRNLRFKQECNKNKCSIIVRPGIQWLSGANKIINNYSCACEGTCGSGGCCACAATCATSRSATRISKQLQGPCILMAFRC